MSQITIQNLHFTYDGDYTPVFEDLSIQLDTNWKLGLVGRNGRGKTTLLRLLSGELEGRGSLSLGGAACLRWPGAVLRPERPAREVLLDGVPPGEEWRLVWELSKLGLEEDVLERPFSTLSGGEQTRALLAALFLDEGGYPMIDEPTNHLDGAGRALVSRYLRELDRGFLLVSHDRAFLDGCVDHILALNHTGPELVRGSFSSWFRNKEDRDRGELARNEKLKGDIRRLEQAAKRTSSWSDQVEKTKYASKNSGLRPDRGFIGHKAAKMMQRAKNLEGRQQRAIAEKSALLRDVERADSLKLAPAAHHSVRLLEARDLAPLLDGRPVCQPLTFTLEQGERVCLEGPNGCGKTSLLRLLLEDALPRAGSLWRAPGLAVSYVSQRSSFLSGSPLDWAEERGLERTRFLTVLRKLDLPRVLFERDMAQYSAGQQKKVLLAASLCQSAHLYVWDEPLNYIDLFSRLQVEELLLEYRPTLLFVEHDRVFQEKIATRVLPLAPG